MESLPLQRQTSGPRILRGRGFRPLKAMLTLLEVRFIVQSAVLSVEFLLQAASDTSMAGQFDDLVMILLARHCQRRTVKQEASVQGSRGIRGDWEPRISMQNLSVHRDPRAREVNNMPRTCALLSYQRAFRPRSLRILRFRPQRRPQTLLVLRQPLLPLDDLFTCAGGSLCRSQTIGYQWR